jgi:hypothetical protein
MALSQAFLEWEQATEARGIQIGIEQGIQIERRNTLEFLLQNCFGNLDETLAALIPKMIQLSSDEYSQFLLTLPNISREDRLARFQ